MKKDMVIFARRKVEPKLTNEIMQHTTRNILIASTLCGICTGILCGILWLVISGVNWFGFLVIDLVFLINACLSGIIAAFIHSRFPRFSITLALYIGNAMPIGLLLLCSYFVADASMVAWYLLFLIGWLIVSAISAFITRILLK